MYKVFTIVLSVLFLCSFTSYAHADINRTIKSASEYDYPPFCIISKDGTADGFSVELLRAALSAVDHDVEFKIGPWEKLKEELSEGTIQVLPLVGRTPEREALYDFTFPYLSLHGAIFVRKGETRIKTLDDLADRAIVVMKGDNAEEFVRRKQVSSHIITTETYAEAMNLLDSGMYDAVIAQRLMGIQLLRELGIKTVVPLDFVIHEFKQDFCFAVKDGDRELLSLLNEGLSIVIADGTFDRLHEKWFGPIIGNPITLNDVLRYFLTAFIPLAIISGLLVIILLRRQVKNKTANLRHEIEERRRAEEELKDKQARLDLALRSSELGVWHLDLNVNKRYFDEQTCKLLNIDHSAFSGTAEEFYAVVHPDDLEKIKAMLTHTIEKDVSYQPEYRVIWKDGSIHYITSRARLLRDDEGRPEKVIGIIWDITERRKAEVRLKWFNDLMKYVISHAQSAIAVHDRDMKYIYVSDQYLKQYKVREKDVIGKHHYDVFPDLPQKWRDVHQRVLAGAVESGDADPYVREDGSVDWTHWECRPWYEYDGSIGGLIVYTEVITERVRREESLRRSKEFSETLIRTANVMIIGLDMSGDITVFNQAAEKITGYTLAELKGRNWFEILVPRDRYPKVWEVFTKLMDGKHVEVFENPILTKSGNERLISWRNSEIVENGKIIGTISFGIDVTEHRKTEEQLRQAQKMEAIGHLAGGIAHDFNNILSAITGYAHLTLIKMKTDDPLRDYIEHIISSSDKAANLIKSLLAFSRKQVMQIKVVNLNTIVSGLKKLLDRIIGEDINFQINTAVNDLIVHADAHQIEQVIMNLVSNARDAMPDGGSLTITTEETLIDEDYVRVHQEGKVGKYAVLSVTDTGMGMDEKTMENIFEPFFTTKEVGKGTGLGLAMSYGTIKQHNGFINLYSEEGKGTTFTIYLPLEESGIHVEEEKASSAVQSGTETVLLVEDDENVREVTRALLEEFGYSVIEAPDMKNALEIYRVNRDRIHIVITDVIMPGQSGKDLYRELKKISADIKIIYISGYPAEALARKEIIDLDVNFLPKPFSPEILLNKIREVLKK